MHELMPPSERAKKDKEVGKVSFQLSKMFFFQEKRNSAGTSAQSARTTERCPASKALSPSGTETNMVRKKHKSETCQENHSKKASDPKDTIPNILKQTDLQIVRGYTIT